MTDATLNRFLASGLAADRALFTPAPPTPASGPDPLYLWFETDTNDTYVWDVGTSAWVQQNSAGAGDMLAANNLSDVASASTSRTNLGATTVGGNVFTLTNPSAVTFLRVNADNTVSALDAATFRTAIGAGTGSGSGDMLAANNLSDVASPSTAATNLGLGTGNSPQFTAINLGHASDTTLTRTGAGDIAVEGNAVYRAGGTDVPVTDGGTGASTASGARTNLSAAAASQTGEQISGFIASPSNKDYRIALDMKHAGTITEVTTRSASGTCTATWKINTTALGGTANSVSSSETTQSHASSNAFAAGDDIVLTVSSNSSCADMSFTIKYTRTLS